MSSEKYEMLKKVQGGFLADKTKNFVIPGLISANETMDEAFENFNSPLENKGNYVKVMFKISYDVETWKDPKTGKKIKDGGDVDMRSTFINLNDKKLTFSPE